MASRPLSLPGRASVRRAGAGACLLVLLAGCGGGPSNANSGGTLRGMVTRGPITPVCRTGTPCSAPAGGIQLQFLQDGGFVAGTGVAEDGTYSIDLPTGTYTVSVDPLQTGRISPGTVRIPNDGSTRTVDFSIDTGIR